MSQELLYTSAPRGLKPGTKGFCTVVCTQGMPAALMQRLEDLSAYRYVFPLHDPNADKNPVLYSHLRIASGGKTLSVVSRIGPDGLDYTQRPNICAHHVVLEPGEGPQGGPAWQLGKTGFMVEHWDGTVETRSEKDRPRPGDRGPAICMNWKDLAGDAGWAGVLAETFLNDPRRTVYLVYEPGTNPLPLIEEALALLPPAQRWMVTFNTYFMGQTQGLDCAWRCVLRGSPEAQSARRLPASQALVLDVGPNQKNTLDREGGLIEQARTGNAPAPKSQSEAASAPAGARADGDALDSRPNRSTAPSGPPAPDETKDAIDLAPEYKPSPPTPRLKPDKGLQAKPSKSKSNSQLPTWFPAAIAASVICFLAFIGIAYNVLKPNPPAAPPPAVAKVDESTALNPDSAPTNAVTSEAESSSPAPEPPQVTSPAPQPIVNAVRGGSGQPPASSMPPDNGGEKKEDDKSEPNNGSKKQKPDNAQVASVTQSKEIAKPADKGIQYIALDSIPGPTQPGMDLTADLQESKPIELTLAGIDDEPIKLSGLMMDPTKSGDGKLTLTWDGKSGDPAIELAVFQIVDRKLSVVLKKLGAESSSSDSVMVIAQKLIGECVLVIKQEGSPTIHLALRPPLERSAFSVPSTSVALFRDSKRPEDRNRPEPVRVIFIDPETAHLHFDSRDVRGKSEKPPSPDGNTVSFKDEQANKVVNVTIKKKSNEQNKEKTNVNNSKIDHFFIYSDKDLKGAKLRVDIFMKVGDLKVLVAKLGTDQDKAAGEKK